MQFLQKAANFMNMLVVAVKRAGDEVELLCRMVAESNIREEYVLQKDEDGEMYCGCSVFCSSVEHG